MKQQLIHFYNLLSSIDFWREVLDKFRSFGIFMPIFLAALESFIPPIPLVGIVALNVAAYGPFQGILYSWIGTCIGCTGVFFFWRKLLLRFMEKEAARHEKLRKAREWVDTMSAPALFLLAMMPFTPSAFLNFAFGVSDYHAGKYLRTIYGAKSVMIVLLGLLGESLVKTVENPLFLVFFAVAFILLYYFSKKADRKFRKHADGK